MAHTIGNVNLTLRGLVNKLPAEAKQMKKHSTEMLRNILEMYFDGDKEFKNGVFVPINANIQLAKKTTATAVLYRRPSEYKHDLQKGLAMLDL